MERVEDVERFRYTAVAHLKLGRFLFRSAQPKGYDSVKEIMSKEKSRSRWK